METKHWNVIVCGGGLAGVCAAVAAARNGASTLLIERDGSLGGTMTNALVGPMMTFHSPERQVIAGLAQEIVDRLEAMNASPGHILDASDYCYTITPFDAEALKLVCQRMVLEAGAKILYHTLVTGTLKDGDRLTGIQITHKAGSETLTADVIIDASGDGDVVALSGAPFEFGRASDGRVQPISLMFKISHVDNDALREYTKNHGEEVRRTEKQLETYMAQPLNINSGFNDKLQAYIKANNVPLIRSGLLFFNTIYEDEFIVNTSAVYGVNPLNPWELSEAENVAREQVFALFDFFKKEIPGFAQSRLVSVGARLGVRESRRTIGEYMLTGQDILEQRRFPDDVVTCAYPVDIHSLVPGEKSSAGYPYHGETYGIPYRCLVPQKIDQLLVAGRCISVTREAQGSMRTSPTVMALGHAAGTAAVLSLREECSPRELNTEKLRETLLREGAII